MVISNYHAFSLIIASYVQTMFCSQMNKYRVKRVDVVTSIMYCKLNLYSCSFLMPMWE